MNARGIKDQATRDLAQKLLDRIGVLEKQVKVNVGNPKQTAGAAGVLRVVEQADGSHVLQLKTRQGWRITQPLTFQDKKES